jgi:hypothetical protein
MDKAPCSCGRPLGGRAHGKGPCAAEMSILDHAHTKWMPRTPVHPSLLVGQAIQRDRSLLREEGDLAVWLSAVFEEGAPCCHT